MTIIHIPAVFLQPKPKDPRDHAVADQPERPDYRPVEPIYIKALKGTLAKDICCNCGKPTKLHFDTSGCNLIGCDGARTRIALGLYENSTTLATYAEPFPELARTLKEALRVDCGVTLTRVFDELSTTEQDAIAHRLARHAWTALQDGAK